MQHLHHGKTIISTWNYIRAHVVLHHGLLFLDWIFHPVGNVNHIQFNIR